ncbi:MAG TPA: hypothetical protein VK083_16240 [Nocardia sp.]|uniref:hypothetical protein n=1 Tax=Nocardia TaxID=1817 RepID=UPI002456295F|nr:MULTISPECIES: hypothetical protein [Nocardia]HLS78333.1 hypothetical protein [Nocardia sp.]
MTESRIDLAHAVALGSIDDEDQLALHDVLDDENPAAVAGFRAEVLRTRDALAALAELTATPPPPGSRARLLAAVAAEAASSQN